MKIAQLMQADGRINKLNIRPFCFAVIRFFLGDQENRNLQMKTEAMTPAASAKRAATSV